MMPDSIRSHGSGDGKMVEWLKALDVLPDDLNSVPSMDVWQLRTTCNSNSGGSDTLFWPLHAFAQARTCAHTQRHTHTN